MKRLWIAILALTLSGCTVIPYMGADDTTTAKALLQQAIVLNQSAIQRTQEAIAALDETTTPVTNAPSVGIDLAAFKWANGKKVADPTSLPSGAKYGEGVESGRRTCQWHYDSWILHAVFSASASSAASAKWYHFTRTATPYPALSQYGWTNTHQTPDASGKVWYRWARTK